MTVVWFILLTLVTVSINFFLTAFFIVRSHHVRNIIKLLRSEANRIIQNVHKATDNCITIAESAESTAKEIKLYIEQGEKLLNIKKTKNHNTPKNSVSSSKRSTLNVEKSLPEKAEKKSFIQKEVFTMLREGKSDDEIRQSLHVSKTELELIKFMDTVKNSNF